MMNLEISSTQEKVSLQAPENNIDKHIKGHLLNETKFINWGHDHEEANQITCEQFKPFKSMSTSKFLVNETSHHKSVKPNKSSPLVRIEQWGPIG